MKDSVWHRFWPNLPRRCCQFVWSIVWGRLPAAARDFLERQPYYRKIIDRRLVVVFWPTFRCNYSCSYCPVHTKFDFATVYPKNSERTWQEWAEALEKLPPARIYFAGGEPLLYAGLPDLLNNLPAKHELLGIVTNLSMPTSVFQKIKRHTYLVASFHREFTSTEGFVAKINELRDSFHIHVNIVATPENLPEIAAIEEFLRLHRIRLHVDPYVDPNFCYNAEQLRVLRKHFTHGRKYLPEFDDFSGKLCSAGKNYINLVPNGDAFTCASGFSYCHSPLFAHVIKERRLPVFHMGNLFDSDFSLNTTDILCSLPCQAYCDRDQVLIKSL